MCKKYLYQLLVLFSFALTLDACNVGREFVRPEVKIAGTYTDFSTDSIATNLDWWQLFNDNVLVNLIDSALVNNKNMQMAISRIQQSHVLMNITRADLYPSVNYGFGGTTTYTSSNSGFSNSVTPVVNVSYTVDLWGKIKNLNDIALQNYLATEYAQRAMKITIISSVAQAYIGLRDIENRLFISKKTAENFQYNLDVMQARYNAGIISEVDLSQAKIQVSEAKTAIEVFNRLRVQIQNSINVLTGNSFKVIPDGKDLYHQLSLQVLPVGLPSELLKRRPDILIAEQKLHTQTIQIGVTESLKYPSLTLSANLGAQLVSPSFFADLGAQLLGPLFNANKINNRITLEELKTEELLLNYENSFLVAINEVRNAMVSVDTYKKEYDLRSEQMELSTRASELSWVRYDGGMTSYLEVLNLQSSQFNAELKASEAYMQQMASLIKLYEALGGGWKMNNVLQEKIEKEQN